MTFQRQIMFWTILLVALILVLYVLSDVLLPFVAGLAIAYFLDPVADRLEGWGLNRLWATLVIVGVFILGFLFFAILIAPILAHQLTQLASNLPGYVTSLRNLVAEWSEGSVADFFGIGTDTASVPMKDILTRITNWFGGLVPSLLSGGMALISLLALFVVTPVVAFYMLYDWDRMIAIVDGWLPRDHQETVRELAREMDTAIAGFVRGQGTVCLILGSFYAVGLTMIGLNSGLVIGLTAGLISFIPYVGSTIGLVVAGGIALVQFLPDWIPVAATVGVFAFGQFAEGNFLSPKLVGDSVGLHPVWLMFALFAFGYLFGFVGMLLAVPLAAAVGVLSRFALRQYMTSKFYKGSPGQSGSEKTRRK
ncbi:MAG: AI-2E family transporter [Fimbriimonadaceae bacterium]|nr:AI-2E family transporter [Alphaproteobacteria bacterium]